TRRQAGRDDPRLDRHEDGGRRSDLRPPGGSLDDDIGSTRLGRAARAASPAVRRQTDALEVAAADRLAMAVGEADVDAAVLAVVEAVAALSIVAAVGDLVLHPRGAGHVVERAGKFAFVVRPVRTVGERLRV